jgi:hypothetical protein
MPRHANGTTFCLEDIVVSSSPPAIPDEWPPKTCQMPDLSGLDTKLSVTMMLNRFFSKAGPSDVREFGYAMNFVRITDKVVRFYEATRFHLTEFVNSANNVFSSIFVATDFAES